LTKEQASLARTPVFCLKGEKVYTRGNTILQNKWINPNAYPLVDCGLKKLIFTNNHQRSAEQEE